MPLSRAVAALEPRLLAAGADAAETLALLALAQIENPQGLAAPNMAGADGEAGGAWGPWQMLPATAAMHGVADPRLLLEPGTAAVAALAHWRWLGSRYGEADRPGRLALRWRWQDALERAERENLPAVEARARRYGEAWEAARTRAPFRRASVAAG